MSKLRQLWKQWRCEHFWRPALEVREYVHVQPRELTGIEKHFIEQEQIARAKVAQAWEEKKAGMLARIAELEKQIAPQTEEIERLRMVIDPYRQYANQANMLLGQQQYQGVYGSLNSLLGIGNIGGRIA